MNFKKATALWTILSALLLSASHLRAQASSQSPVGTWQFVLKFPDSSESRELLTFSRDGRALTTMFPIADVPGSSRWGEWRQNGGAMDYTSYTILSEDPNAGFLRARCRLSMGSEGSKMSGNCVAELTDPDGNVSVSLATFEVTAKRLPLVPLE